MSTKYLHANSNASTAVWYDATGGSTVVAAPANDDAVVLNGYTLTLDVPAFPASGTLLSITDNAKLGAVLVPLDTNGSCEINATSIVRGRAITGFIQVTGITTNTLTVRGNLSGGDVNAAPVLYSSSTGNIIVIGTPTGGGTANYNGITIAAAGTLRVIGAPTGGTVGIGVAVTAAATVIIDGDTTGGSLGGAAYGVSVTAAATVTFNGAVTGGATAMGLYTSGLASGATIVINGNVVATGSSGIYNAAGTTNITVNGSFINSQTVMAYAGIKAPIWTNTGARYWECYASNETIKLGKQPLAGQLATGVVCGDVTGTLDGETHTADQVVSSAGGNYHEPERSEVWNDVVFGLTTGTKRASSIANLTAGNVKLDVVVDDVTGAYLGTIDPDKTLTTGGGNWIPAADADVRLGTPNGLDSAGTLVVPVLATPASGASLSSIYARDEITITRYARDEYNEPLPNPTIIYAKGRWEEKSRLVRNLAGEEVVSSANFSTSVEIIYTDVVTFKGTNYQVVSKETPSGLSGGFSGAFHKVYFA